MSSSDNSLFADNQQERPRVPLMSYELEAIAEGYISGNPDEARSSDEALRARLNDPQLSSMLDRMQYPRMAALLRRKIAQLMQK